MRWRGGWWAARDAPTLLPPLPCAPPPALWGACSALQRGGVVPRPPGVPPLLPRTQGGGMLVLAPHPHSFPPPKPPPAARVWSMAPQVPASGGQHEDRAVSWIFFLIERLLLHCLFYQYGS